MEELLMKLELFYYCTNIPLRLYDNEKRQIASDVLTSQIMPAFLGFDHYERKLLDLSVDTFY
jgi:hypothetical protein